ncbi:hypothetical protein PQO01_04230 [Lentisphaera marina]|uniref:hypothetical protein n=1 Tax=Lentisphaera marina TaxID=1111041 RepID=UPI00236597A2|nr:hypothetical protein [Lentisphaera marina]MDD7984160.1 hypothetical protein [Lentisphaera marina]
MKIRLLISSAIFLSCTSSEPNYDYKSVEIDEIMENMDEPTWLLNRMQKSNHLIQDDWLQQLSILQEESHALIAIQHPDKFFRDEAQRTAQYIDDFIAQLPSLKREEQFKKWSEVKKSCDKCHEVYE